MDSRERAEVLRQFKIAQRQYREAEAEFERANEARKDARDTYLDLYKRLAQEQA